jgi:hypothetical protein
MLPPAPTFFGVEQIHDDWLASVHPFEGGGESMNPANPEAPFRCEHYRCTLAAKVCVQRQTERIRVPSTGQMKVPWRNDYCASGVCAQGAAVLVALKGARIRKTEDRSAMNRAAATAAGQATVARIEAKLAATTSTPAPPAEEKAMAEKLCSKDGCGRLLRSDNKTGICGFCASGKGLDHPLRKKPTPVNPAPVAVAAKSAKAVEVPLPLYCPAREHGSGCPDGCAGKPTVAPIEDLLRTRLDYHRGQVAMLLHHQLEAAKLERALAAMMEAA